VFLSVALLKLDNDSMLSLSKRNLILTKGSLNSFATAASLASLALAVSCNFQQWRSLSFPGPGHENLKRMHLGLISIMDAPPLIVAKYTRPML
jgi:hypothetical protein